MISLIKTVLKKSIPPSIVSQTLKCRGDNLVLLTFDDGPNPQLTPLVLDLLDEFDAQACFFVVGKFVEQFPDILVEILRRGHVVGNHTQSHPARDFRSYDEYRKDVQLCQETVSELVAHQMAYLRPPRGKLSINCLRVARSLRLHTVLWSCGGGEYRTYKSDYVKSVAHNVVTSIKDGDICVLHDDNPRIAEILKIVLPSLKEREFNLRDGIAYL